MKTETIENTDVLIVGAGPVGLITACLLSYHGIRVYIIDKNTHTSQYSGALFIQGRTLEILDQLGLANRFVDRGQIPKHICVLKNSKLIFKANIENMGLGLSKFPYVLMIKQSETEKILIDYLLSKNIQVSRNSELTNINQQHNEVLGTIKRNNNSFQVNCKYLIGADGAKSTVKQLLKIGSKEQFNPSPLFIFDGEASFSYLYNGKEREFDHETLYFSLCGKYTTGFFPIPENKWRIDGIIPSKIHSDDTYSFETVKSNFNSTSCIKGVIHNKDWFSIFRTRTSLANSYQKGNCFLAGDAAHVHTPIGAQGMNTGIQDAYNLCWKLAFVIQNKVSEDILNSYHAERYLVSKKLINSTDRLFFLVIRNSALHKAFRNLVFPLLLRLLKPIAHKARLQKSFYKSISETEIRYPPFNKHKKGDPNQGERLPYLSYYNTFKEKKNLHGLVNGKEYLLLVFAKKNQIEAGFSDELIKLSNNNILKTTNIPYIPKNKALYNIFRIKTQGWYLIRPDMHIEKMWIR